MFGLNRMFKERHQSIASCQWPVWPPLYTLGERAPRTPSARPGWQARAWQDQTGIFLITQAGQAATCECPPRARSALMGCTGCNRESLSWSWSHRQCRPPPVCALGVRGVHSQLARQNKHKRAQTCPPHPILLWLVSQCNSIHSIPTDWSTWMSLCFF